VQSHALKSQAHTAQLQQQFASSVAKQQLLSEHHLEVQLIKEYEHQEPKRCNTALFLTMSKPKTPPSSSSSSSSIKWH
jgi:hypothetical protein